MGHDAELDGGGEILKGFADQQDIPERIFDQ